MTVTIVRAESHEQFETIRVLLHEYMAWDIEVSASLGVDTDELVSQAYENGQFQLPGKYLPPDGLMLLASVEGRAAGCAAWRRMDDTTCEIKRVYVRPDYRGMRIGKTLLETLLHDIRQQGFTRVLLETVTFMHEAISLYQSLGFRPSDPYFEVTGNLKAVTVFMELRLE